MVPKIYTAITFVIDAGFIHLGKITRLSPSAAQPTTLSSQELAAISLPPSLFAHERISDRSNVAVFFGYYKNDALFPDSSVKGNEVRQPQVCSGVVAATVALGRDNGIENLGDNVTISFRRENKVNNTMVCITCKLPGSELFIS